MPFGIKGKNIFWALYLHTGARQWWPWSKPRPSDQLARHRIQLSASLRIDDFSQLRWPTLSTPSSRNAYQRRSRHAKRRRSGRRKASSSNSRAATWALRRLRSPGEAASSTAFSRNVRSSRAAAASSPHYCTRANSNGKWEYEIWKEYE